MKNKRAKNSLTRLGMLDWRNWLELLLGSPKIAGSNLCRDICLVWECGNFCNPSLEDDCPLFRIILEKELWCKVQNWPRRVEIQSSSRIV